MFLDTDTLIERHGEEVFVMSQDEFRKFTKFLKSKHPEAYKELKEDYQFDVTPVTLIS